MSKSRLRSIPVELFELAGRHTALHASEASMEPVLSQFRDQVLYLKHNLNAAAIGSLRGTADTIQGDLQRLLKQMNASIAEADQFVQLP